MQRVLIIILLSFFSHEIYGQSNRIDSLKALYFKQKDVSVKNQADTPRTINPPGEVNIMEEESITKLNNYYLKNPSRPEGYRVHLYSGTREEVQEIKTKFANVHGSGQIYTTYLAPNFRLRVGDFRTKMEAEKFKAQIQNEFAGCYVIKDRTELPRLE